MADLVDRLKVALADRYRIERELGAGGMATVYLAEDLKHHRQVAVKVLRPELSALLGADRFVKEIELTANLQHPHLLPLFDSGEAAGHLYYVMPYVAGESLRARLTGEKQLGVAEAVRITTQVASALDYAHRHGVLHRDIKPENILLHEGQALIADFGIALALRQAGGNRLTETGLSLGTPQYMSPEQAGGDRALDARSDIYSLGCVLYEMLTGEPPHTGPTVQAVIAKLLADRVRPVTELRSTVPVHVAAALEVALAKLPADRFESAGGFAAALTNPGAMAIQIGAPQSPRRRAIAVIASLGLVAAVAAVAWQVGMSSQPPERILRFAELIPLANVQRQEGRLALSPDGRQLAAVVSDDSGRSHVELRSRDQLQSQKVEGTDGAIGVFFSPDGTRIGVLSDNPLELKVGSPGGLFTSVAPMRGGVAGGIGGAWGADGWIYVGGPGFRTIRRYRPDGSAQEEVTALDSAAGEWWQGWPQPIRDGKAVLFTVRMRNLEYRIAAADLSQKLHHVVAEGVQARLLPSGQLLVVAEDGGVRAARFDERRLKVVGDAIPVIEGLRIRSLGAVDLVVAGDRTVGYQVGETDVVTGNGGLTWVARDGAFEAVPPLVEGALLASALSPDGLRLVVSGKGEGRDGLLVRGLDDRMTVRLSREPVVDPQWMPDGRRVSFIGSGSGADQDLFVQPADGSEPAGKVLDLPGPILWHRWSPAGGWVVFRQFGDALEDLFAIRPGLDSVPLTVAATPANECSATFAADGRWVAYVSDESGQPEVFVRPFPNVTQGRWQVSASGGAEPVWNPNGQELHYRDLDGTLWSARVRVDTTFTVTARERLVDTRRWRPFTSVCGTPYTVSPRDGRFLFRDEGATRRRGRVVFVEGFGRMLEDATRRE